MDHTAIRLLILFKLKPGQLGPFRQLAESLTIDTQAREPRTQSYEWYLNADQSECWISERYLDSEALIEHSRHVNERLKLLTQLVDITEVLILGSPSDELVAVFAPLGAKVLKCFSGFCR